MILVYTERARTRTTAEHRHSLERGVMEKAELWLLQSKEIKNPVKPISNHSLTMSFSHHTDWEKIPMAKEI